MMHMLKLAGQRQNPRGRARAMLPAFSIADAVIIRDREHLTALSPAVVRSICDDFNAETLAARLCPVLMSDQSVALFALAEYVGSDQADELVRRVVAKGHTLASPARYVLDAPLLLAVSRNQLAVHNDGEEPHQGLHSRTALADAFQDLVEWGVRHGASDLHVNLYSDRAESEVKYTMRGRYVAPERFRHMATSMLSDMLAVAWMDVRGGNGALFDPRTEQQGSLIRRVDGNDVVVRWASLAADNGPSVCLRLLVRNINIEMTSLAALGYLPAQIQTIERIMLSEGGAIVFAGTVGSGKSTTLATLISGLPADRKIITIEDPVEYRIPNAIQNTVVRTLSDAQPRAYAAKLRTIKRSAMSDVLLGEIRDQETGQAFMDIAGSGINVYTTVHASSAAMVPDRLASDFIGVSRDFLLTPATLRLLAFQTLVNRLCPQCSQPVSRLLAGGSGADGRNRTGRYWGEWLERIQCLYRIDVTSMRIRNDVGCAGCGVGGVTALKGYSGRTVVAELIEPGLQPDYLSSVRTAEVGSWLRRQSAVIMQHGLQAPSAWHSAMDSAVIKALAGEIDPRDIERHFQSFETRWHATALNERFNEASRIETGPAMMQSVPVAGRASMALRSTGGVR